jgi:antitoxin CptB
MSKQSTNKLKFLSWHRGTRENDLILGSFADKNLSLMTESELMLYAQLLQEPDGDIFAWIVQHQPPPKHYERLIQWIRDSQTPPLK